MNKHDHRIRSVESAAVDDYIAKSILASFKPFLQREYKINNELASTLHTS